MSKDGINYELLLNRAMRSVVKGALKSIEKNDYMPGEHCFYISFLTHYIGVKLSPRLLKKYPEEITIVLEDSLQDLVVEDDRFSVTLRFNGIKENICVPYLAITTFSDPSADIKLKFTITQEERDAQEPIATLKGNKMAEVPSNVISFEQLRKNKNNRT